jgi:ubiquinone/menaquinone biosynthesis C-methylase UbiE
VFVLEHLARPVETLAILSRVLKPGGTMTVIEGDHGSAYFHPDSSMARDAIACQIELQRLAGGNALIGRQLYPLMLQAAWTRRRVHEENVHGDD